MTTPIETTRSKLPGDMAHMMPAQSTDPKEYQQVQRRKKDNVPRDLIGNVTWYEDNRQPEPGYIIWRADKKGQQIIAHIEYIETEDAWFGLHYVKGIPYATIGSKIDEGKYGLRRKGGKTPNLYLWRNNPEPLSEEETPSEIPTILQTKESSPILEGLDAITQGMATIPTQNQPMDDEEDAPAVLDCKIYPLSHNQDAKLTKFLGEHLRKGYIRESKSPYTAPFFFIKKKDGKLRPVQDYRKLNEQTIRDNYPLPLIKTILEQLQGRSLFTKFDI